MEVASSDNLPRGKDKVKNTRTRYKKGAENCILISAIHRLKQEKQITD